MRKTGNGEEVPRVRLLQDEEADLRRSSRLTVIEPPPQPNYWLQRIVLMVIAVLVLCTAIGIVGLLVRHTPDRQIASSSAVVILDDGTEVPEEVYLASITPPPDPTITDLRDKDGRNGMWYKVLKEGQIVRLWREPDDRFIRVEFASGVQGKCTKLQKLTVGTPWAKFTHVQQWDSGWARQDFIAFEATCPRNQLSAVRKIQRGAAGEVTFDL